MFKTANKAIANLIKIAATAALITSIPATAFAAKNLIFCSEGSPEGFDPALYASSTTFDASAHPIYDGLMDFKNGTTSVVPGLAEKYEVSDDGLEYTFHLRQGVKFQTTDYFTPSRDFNADDVIFSFERQMDKNNPYNKVSGGSWEFFNSMSMPELIKDIVKVDDYTVKFVLTRLEAPMIANLAMPFASIVSKEYADKLLAEGKLEMLNQKPVGTGAFQLVNYQKDAAIRYKANPDYWQGKAMIDNLIFAITPDASVRYQKLKADECQVMVYPNPADIEAMKTDKDINLLEKPGLNIGYLGYNTMMKPFDNPKVRKALNMAINKKAIIEAIYQGGGTVAKNPIPPTIWSYNDDVKDDEYNPQAARKILAEEGVKDLKTKIWAMPVQRPYNPNARRMAELIQSDWKAVGVDAAIISYEWGEYLKRSKAKDRDGAVLLGWTGDNGDPDNFLAVLLGCAAAGEGNRANWCYKPFDDIVVKAKQINDQSEREKLYKKAQVIFKEQAPWATIAHSIVYQPVRKRVKNFKISPLGNNDFYEVDIADK